MFKGKIELDEEEFRRDETRLRNIAKPMVSDPIHFEDGSCGIAMAFQSQWIRIEKYKIYIEHVANFEEDFKVKCPKCNDYHAGFGVWGKTKDQPNTLFMAFQFDQVDGIEDECSKDIYLAVEKSRILNLKCPNCNNVNTLLRVKNDCDLDNLEPIKCPKCNSQLNVIKNN